MTVISETCWQLVAVEHRLSGRIIFEPTMSLIFVLKMKAVSLRVCQFANQFVNKITCTNNGTLHERQIEMKSGPRKKSS